MKNNNIKTISFLNARRGFATNSSSSHSMLLLDKENKSIKDDDDGESFSSFGWSFFTLASSDIKKNYLSSLMAYSLEKDFGEKIAKQILIDLSLLDDNDELIPIDHQSVFPMPMSPDSSVANISFIKDFAKWAMRPDVLILGGNDNTDHTHPLTEDGLRFDISSWLSQGDLIAKKDDSNNTWTLFSRKNGLSLRFSFDNIQKLKNNNSNIVSMYETSNTPSSTPNLVDVKITDMCPYKCEYCYQSSTPTAPHAPTSKLILIADSLAKGGVFEAALGGGETTLHPNFDMVVDEFYKRGVTPNITTRNLSWVKNPSSIQTMKKLGSFAISVDNVSLAKKALKAIDEMESNFEKIREKEKDREIRVPTPSFQIVVGAQPEDEFKKILELIYSYENLRPKITLLGYKDVGFGEDFIDKSDHRHQVNTANENWINWTLQAHANASGSQYGLWISIDTALAKVSEEKLKKSSENNGARMYHTVEGAHSMYIDAVRNTMAPSSFAPRSEEIEFNEDKWLDDFRSFSKPKKKSIGLKLK